MSIYHTAFKRVQRKRQKIFTVWNFFVLEESVLHNGGMYSESNHFYKDFCSRHVAGHELPRRNFFFFLLLNDVGKEWVRTVCYRQSGSNILN